MGVRERSQSVALDLWALRLITPVVQRLYGRGQDQGLTIDKVLSDISQAVGLTPNDLKARRNRRDASRTA